MDSEYEWIPMMRWVSLSSKLMFHLPTDLGSQARRPKHYCHSLLSRYVHSLKGEHCLAQCLTLASWFDYWFQTNKTHSAACTLKIILLLAHFRREIWKQNKDTYLNTSSEYYQRIWRSIQMIDTLQSNKYTASTGQRKLWHFLWVTRTSLMSSTCTYSWVLPPPHETKYTTCEGGPCDSQEMS